MVSGSRSYVAFWLVRLCIPTEDASRLGGSGERAKPGKAEILADMERAIVGSLVELFGRIGEGGRVNSVPGACLPAQSFQFPYGGSHTRPALAEAGQEFNVLSEG